MGWKRINKEDVRVVIKALLLSQKEAIYTGVPIAQLDNDYYNSEGIRIPFRQLGYSSLFNFLRTLTDILTLKYKNGNRVAFLVEDENTKKIQSQSLQLPARVDGKTFTEILTMIKETPDGIWITRIIEYANRRMNCNVDVQDLTRRLSDISHELIIEKDAVYPIGQYSSKRIDFLQPRTNCTESGPAGDTDYDSEDEPIPRTANSTRYGECESQQNIEEPRDNNCLTDETSCRDDRHDFENENGMRNIVHDSVKQRLQNLILKYPDGIWCADLPTLYEEEYEVPLNYEELGIYSVLSFASYLPDIFHCVQPQDKGDYKLYDARVEKPSVKETKIPVKTTFAASYDVYGLNGEIPEPVPVLSKDIANRLIPDDVMKIGETIAQISVIELHQSPNATLEVIIVELFTPSFFWIQLHERMPNFELFMDELHDFYEKEARNYLIPPAIIAKGLNCACKYREQWHRGIITNVTDDRKVTVLFYDYGTLDTYKPDYIHFLYKSFANLPAQAIPCGLYNIKPLGTAKWSKSVTMEFADKVLEVPLFAMIAQIDTENNSMLIGLTDTRDKEDLHINDWLVNKGYAEYGKMGETVRLNDRIYDGSMTSSPVSPIDAADRKRVTSSTIEEDANSRSVNYSSVDNALAYSQFFNSKALLSITWCMADINECKQRGIPLESRVRSKLEGFKNLITMELAGASISSISSDDRSVPDTALPEANTKEDIVVETTAPSTSHDPSPIMTNGSFHTNVQSTPSQELVYDVNRNVSNKSCIDDSTNTSEIALASVKHENADDHISNDLCKKKSTTNASSDTIASRYETSSIVSSDYPVEEPTRTSLTPRMVFEDSLLQSANDFFQRMQITTRATPNLESSNDQLSSTNPFKKDTNKVCKTSRSRSVPSHPLKSSLRRPHRAMNPQIKTEPSEPTPTRVTYESGPILYAVNVDSWIENNGGRTTNGSYAYACEKRNVVGEREWTGISSRIASRNLVSIYHSTVDNSKEASPSLSRVEPPRVFGGNGNGTCLSPANWLKAIENAIDFKKELGANQNNGIDGKRSSRRTKNTIIQNGSNELSNCWTIPLTGRRMYLITYEGKGWVALHEFAAFINTSPNAIVESVSPENINVTFRLIRRYDNIQLFEKLDRSSLNVPRDHNNRIGHALNLTSLAYVLQILIKLKLVTNEQIDKAKNERIFPEDSSLLRDVCTLNTASVEYINLTSP